MSLREHIKPILGNDQCFSTHYQALSHDSFGSKKFVSGHFGLMPIDYMDNPYIFTIVRDPISRFISYIKYTKKIFEYMDDLEYLEYCLYEVPEAYSNMQTKFLSGYTDIEKYNGSSGIADKVSNLWYLEGYSDNAIEVLNTIDHIDIFTLDQINLIPFKISDVLGIPAFRLSIAYNGSDPRVFIPEKHYDRIRELNEQDIILYNEICKRS